MADVDPSAFLKAEKNTGDSPIKDFKKCVWVPDENEGFVSAVVKEQTGDVATLELANGSVSLDYTHFSNIHFLFFFCIICRSSLWTSMTPVR